MYIKNKRIEYISLLSVLSAIAVVFLHCAEYVKCFSLTEGTGINWFVANFIHSIFFPAVPIFFMISGAMLFNFNSKYDLKTYVSKRISKTVIPYVVWSIFFYSYHVNFT